MAINDDKIDPNVEMKVVLYEYGLSNPYVEQPTPRPLIVKSNYTGVNEFDVSFENASSDGTAYD